MISNENRSLRVSLAHIISSSKHEIDPQTQESKVTYHSGFTVVSPIDSDPKCFINTTCNCSVCDADIPVQLFQQRMLWLDNETAIDNLNLIRKCFCKGKFYWFFTRGVALLSILLMLIPAYIVTCGASLYCANKGIPLPDVIYNDTMDIVAIVALSVGILMLAGAFVYNDEARRNYLATSDLDKIIQQKAGLLISSNLALSRKFNPSKELAEITIVRKLVIPFPNQDHRFRLGLGGTSFVSGWFNDKTIKVTGENLNRKISFNNQFGDAAVEIGAMK